jgi:hypothetical protein
MGGAIGVGLTVTGGAAVGIGAELAVQAGSAVEDAGVLACVDIGAIVATGAAAACIWAIPSLATCGSRPCTSECIPRKAPAPSAPKMKRDPRTAFADMESGRDTMLVSLGHESSSDASISDMSIG